jgi:hypothetical protein
MGEEKSRWERYKDRAIVFSFIVNAGTIVVLVLGGFPAIQVGLFAKDQTVEPLLSDLDAAFVQLGESEIVTDIDIDEEVDIRFNLPLDQPLDIDFPLTIQQNTIVVLTEPVPLVAPATFNLPGGGGSINGTVSLSLPTGMRLPIRLDMTVPVQSTIPVRLNVPVDQKVPIRMTVPVNIKLGESGLDPAVQALRKTFMPVGDIVYGLPNSMIPTDGE